MGTADSKIMRFQCNFLKNVYYGSSGHKLRRAIQNNSTPLMDLYVRESLQNSLDAALPDAQEVFVNYAYGDFDIDYLSDFYDELGPKIQERKAHLSNQYVAICDSNTVGLIGREDGVVRSCESKGQNLANLVFNIQNAQQTEGSGGSWGLGKTVFYRMSDVGLIIFYSRIRNENGEYEERLVSVLVEDEAEPEKCFFDFSDYVGLAFFGKNQNDPDGGQTRTKVITDHDFCSSVLKTFRLQPYEGDQTGTMIIVPFLSLDAICSVVPNYTQHDNNANISWATDFGLYLRTCILRWYTPRMSKFYRNGPRLVARINGSPIKFGEEDIFFSLFGDLYSTIVSEQCRRSAPRSDYKIRVEAIKAERGYSGEKILGWIGFVKVSAGELGVVGSSLEASIYPPAVYAGLDLSENDDSSRVITAYCRKPGMINAYNMGNEWTPRAADLSLAPDEYVLGLFVLNSSTEIFANGFNYSLEEYVRKNEKADHFSWSDSVLENGSNRRAILQIKKGVCSKMKDALCEKTERETELNNNFVWQKKLSNWLPEGRGKRSSPVLSGPDSGISEGRASKNVKIKVYDGAKFLSGGLKKDFLVEAKDRREAFSLEIGVISSSSTMTVEKLTDFGLFPPFSISSFIIKFEKGCSDRSLVGEVVEINPSQPRGAINKALDYEVKKIDSGVVYGISFSSKMETLRFKLGVVIDLFDSSFQLAYAWKAKEISKDE